MIALGRICLLLALVLGFTPFGSLVRAADGLLPADRPIAEVVDHYIDAKLRSEGIKPAPRASDENWLRRVTLDLAGRIPTPSEVRSLLDDRSADRYRSRVEALMTSPDFLEQQVNEFNWLLMGSQGNLRDYLQKSFEENRSWDRLFRELVAGDYSQPELKGAQEFLKTRIRDVDQLTNDVSSIFFGVNISCAQCHDHPLVDDWKQDHFFGLKSFLNRSFENGGFIGERDYGTVSFLTPKGESRSAKFMFLSGRLIDVPEAKEPDNKAKKEEQDRLKALADKKEPPPPPQMSLRSKLVETALSDAERPRLARAIVNRIWNRFFGRGLVMPVDQMHSENPPSHPELLDWLARDFAEHGFDVRRTMQGLALSAAYARSSRWEAGAPPAASLFAVAQVRPLTPWQFGYALRMATTDPEQFNPSVEPKDITQRLNAIRAAGRGLAGQFQPPAERFQVSVNESLAFTNAQRFSADLLEVARGRLVDRLQQVNDPQARVELAAWSVWGRAPDAEETELLTRYLTARSDRPQDANQQLVWMLVTSSEFRFNY